MTKYIYFITFFLHVTFHSISAQSDFIAKIGNKELTREEFKNRYELSPRILANNSSNRDSIKLNFLYSLLSEKLWAIEALNSGIALSEEFDFYFTPIEKMYVRDELFRIEIKDKVTITDTEIFNGITKYNKNLLLRIITSNDSSDIYGIFNKIIDLGSIDSLLISNPNMSSHLNSLEIKFGDLTDEVLEEKIYRLNLNEFTVPLIYDNKWYVYEINGIKSSIPDNNQDKIRRDVEEIIRNRKIRNLYDDFYEKYFGDYLLEAEKDIFSDLSKEFYKVLLSRIGSQEVKEQHYFLTESDVLEVKKILGPDFLEKVMFTSEYGPVKVYDFLSDLTIVEVAFEEIEPSVINKALSNELRRFMQQETIYRIGNAMGINYSNEVEDNLNMWRDNILSQILKNSYNSEVKVSDSEINLRFKKVYSDSSILSGLYLQMLTAPDLETTEMILNYIENGESFDQIINKFSPDKNVYSEYISDFRRLNEFREGLNIIAELDAGDIWGPVKTRQGYSIIKVIYPGIISDSLITKISEVKTQLYQELFYNKLNNLLENETVKLADKYGITLSEDFLYSESYSDVNLFVHRYMGFGGRIAAVPIVTPFYNWFYKWKDNRKINP